MTHRSPFSSPFVANNTVMQFDWPEPVWCYAAAVLAACLLAIYCWAKAKPTVYVLDFSVFDPPDNWKFPKSMIRKVAEGNNSNPLAERHVAPEHIDFMCRLAERTGLGDETPVLPETHLGDITMAGTALARSEFHRTCITTAEALFKKTGIKPQEVNFVITNCSLFNPVPSLSAAVINHFKMGHRTRGFALGGMGCSAGVIALGLAQDLLQAHPGSLALVVSHENICNATYTGRDPSMLISNVLFRCNGAAVLLSSKPRHARSAKYTVQHIVCTHLASDDEAYGCVQLTEDDAKITGIRLKQELVPVAERVLRQNMQDLGPLVLPVGEKVKYAASYVARRLAKSGGVLAGVLPGGLVERQYIPDFKKAFDFFCIHTGGRGIIDALEKHMALSRRQVEPSRAALYRFGNTSSTSVWYDLAFIEAFQGLTAGQRVWQLAFGSGVKFNSAVLVASRSIADAAGHPAWRGFDRQAMWGGLDRLEAAAAAARAAKAARLKQQPSSCLAQ